MNQPECLSQGAMFDSTVRVANGVSYACSLLLAFLSSAAFASDLKVDSHSVLRLPASSEVLQLEKLHVAEQGTLLVPANVTELHIGHLGLDVGARLGIAPSDKPLKVTVAHASIAQDAQILAHGAAGSAERQASSGRELYLSFAALESDSFVIDVRGGRGQPGRDGLDGAHGEAGNCTWARASAGENGQSGEDGQPGASGGVVHLTVPASAPVERIQVLLEGGAGGYAGAAGKAGRGGGAKDCLMYSVAGAADGSDGRSGQVGVNGPDGRLHIVQRQ